MNAGINGSAGTYFGRFDHVADDDVSASALIGTALSPERARGGLGSPNAEASQCATHRRHISTDSSRADADRRLSDGPLGIGDPSGAFLGVSKQEIGDMLSRISCRRTTSCSNRTQPWFKYRSKLVLFDSGMGTNTMFGKTTGRLVRSLREAGIDPRNIDAVVISHGHIDHLGGLVGAKDVRLFPNAQIFISQADFDFWTDESKPAR